MAEHGFQDDICSLLDLLVPVILIPGMPEVLSGHSWDWEGEQIDQNQREKATAIASYLTRHATAHERLKGIKPPTREYHKIKKAILATSESYRNTLIPHATELWLTGTSYAGDRYKKWQRVRKDAHRWDERTYKRAKRLLSTLQSSPITIINLNGLEMIADEVRRSLLGTSVI